MRTMRRWSPVLVCLASLVATSVGMPAFGHDPLRDEYDHRSEHDNDMHQRAILTDVRALLVSFRESGNDIYLDEAWALLEPALQSASPGPRTLTTAAYVAQSRHQFEYAISLVTEALAVNGDNDEGWLLLASIQLVLGDAESAAKACRQLRAVPPLVLLTCNARVALEIGDFRAASARLRGVLNLPDAQRLPPDILAWSYSVAADLAVAAGEAQQAVALYQHSLGLAERTQVRAALVDVFLNECRYENARQALDAGSPALPLLVRRLIVAKQLGRLDEMRSVLAKVQNEFEAWIANEDWLHAREMARFYIDVVDQPGLARRLAVINASLQHEPEDLRLLSRTR